ncbi:hypothetical protein KSS87_007017 [Heliosperma pusillum]|nr:hypothetical protein KSS87_007017 [Heliosperma pusillum]
MNSNFLFPLLFIFPSCSFLKFTSSIYTSQFLSSVYFLQYMMAMTKMIVITIVMKTIWLPGFFGNGDIVIL